MSDTNAEAQAETDAAVTLAEASAAQGAVSAQAGFQLTTQALNQPEAVFPLLVLELTAIAEGFAAYAATDTNWLAAVARAETSELRATAFWKTTP